MTPRPAEGTWLFGEAAQAPGLIAAQQVTLAPRLRALAERLRAAPPRAVITCARGSSDHAATYARYLIETRLGLLTASAAPSVSSVYGRRLDVAGCLFLAISQSGRSPDLIAAAGSARAGGAQVLALVNAPDSPLAAVADTVLPLGAGPEQSVAASKSYLATLAALAQFVGWWSEDAQLIDGTTHLSARLAEAWQLDWAAALPVLESVRHLYVLGRGVGLAIAQEAALKFKETCGLHAEGISGAEVRHGPQALLGPDFPALLLSQDDETRPGQESLAVELAERGVKVLLAGANAPGALCLPGIDAHPLLQPILLAQRVYRLVNALALARGRDPDRPPHLAKVTETL
jgi:glucosamine--fructose-6-phosphate aminotransferase (isomerizing)